MKRVSSLFTRILGEEKNVPTNPKLWSKFKSKRSLMYILLHMPTVAKKYKPAGGSWRSESVEFDELVDQLDEYITSKQVKMEGVLQTILATRVVT